MLFTYTDKDGFVPPADNASRQDGGGGSGGLTTGEGGPFSYLEEAVTNMPRKAAISSREGMTGGGGGSGASGAGVGVNGTGVSDTAAVIQTHLAREDKFKVFSHRVVSCSAAGCESLRSVNSWPSVRCVLVLGESPTAGQSTGLTDSGALSTPRCHTPHEILTRCRSFRVRNTRLAGNAKVSRTSQSYACGAPWNPYLDVVGDVHHGSGGCRRARGTKSRKGQSDSTRRVLVEARR